MIAYTGIETVSNLAEEARDPTNNVPRAYQLLTRRGLRDLLHPPGRCALGAARRDQRRADPTLLALPPEEGGFQNDPVLGVVEGPRTLGHPARRADDLCRRSRGDDPVHRDERRRDRCVSDHVRDVDLSTASRGVPPGCTLGSRPPGSPLSSSLGSSRSRRCCRAKSTSRDDVLVRRDAVLHDRAHLDRRPALSRRRAPSSCFAGGRTSVSRGSIGRSSRS